MSGDAGGEREVLAVCDVLVYKALEAMGKRLVRSDRSRYRILGARPVHTAHMLWPPSDAEVDKALRGAWDVVPALIPDPVRARRITLALDSYVHDLVITGTAHTRDELAYRLERASTTLHLGQ